MSVQIHSMTITVFWILLGMVLYYACILCMSVRACACMCMYVHVWHVYACMCMCVHVCARMCMYVHVCVCMYVHVCARMCMYTMTPKKILQRHHLMTPLHDHLMTPPHARHKMTTIMTAIMTPGLRIRWPPLPPLPLPLPPHPPPQESSTAFAPSSPTRHPSAP